MNGIVAAFAATGLYYIGFAVFKLAADRMEPLRGDRVFHIARIILSSGVFLGGLALVLGGLGLQILALRELSLGIAVPIFMSGVLPLLVIAMVFFGDRLTGREWLSLLLIAAAAGLLAASIGNPPPIRAVDVPGWRLAMVVAPALLVPLILLLTGESRPDGRHARPITGIAYGLGSGVPIGTAELCIKGWSDAGIGPDGLATPYPYVTVVSAVIGFGILMLAFQRCRVSIVAAVMTVTAKAHLLVTGTLLFGEPWPGDAPHFAMRVGALLLAAIALLQFPRHRPVAGSAPPPEAGSGRPRPGSDPFGRPAHDRFAPGPHAFPQPLPAPPAEGPSAFDRPHGRAVPGHGGPPRSAAGHLAPDRDTGPHALFDPVAAGPYETGERPLPVPPPRPGPYAQDPLGRGPDARRDVFDDGTYEIEEQFGTGPFGIVGSDAEAPAENDRWRGPR
ncbi:hypothetical protein [Spirillospora sp. NPDC029432]|uniref:hypothetical protein n=1 Tax=Spirillospora sp. NPDC029432 TaxID=3154599 RepID=UPI003455F3ED